MDLYLKKSLQSDMIHLNYIFLTIEKEATKSLTNGTFYLKKSKISST